MRFLFKMKQIRTVERIMELAYQGKSVWVPNWKRTSSAAFLQNWQARLLYAYIKKGEFFEYKTTEKAK